MTNGTGQRKTRAIKRLKVINAFRLTDTAPESMVLDNIPVIPPDLHPMVQLDTCLSSSSCYLHRLYLECCKEMVTSYILGFFINGLYQLFVLYFMGWVIPIGNPTLVLSRGYGIRNAVSLLGILF